MNEISRIIYSKINTLWKREGKEKKGVIIESDFSMPEFNAIKYFEVSEKINGRNTRITFVNGRNIRRFDGRNDDSEISSKLIEYLNDKFTIEKLSMVSPESNEFVLVGEAYGPKMNTGSGAYREDISFILFDVWIDGWWLTRSNIEDIAKKLDIDVVPLIGIMSVDEIISFVKSKPQSLITKNQLVMEGVVAKSSPMMMFRNGCEPIMFKLKVKDYEKLDKLK